MGNKLQMRIYKGAKGRKNGYNGAFLHFTENIQKIIGGNGKVSVIQEGNVLTILPDDDGNVIGKNHDNRWKVYVGGKQGEFLQKYEKHIYSTISVEDVHAFADVNVNLKKLIINLDEYDKEEETQEEIKMKPEEKGKYSVYDMGQALMHLLKVQDEILERLTRLEEASK